MEDSEETGLTIDKALLSRFNPHTDVQILSFNCFSTTYWSPTQRSLDILNERLSECINSDSETFPKLYVTIKLEKSTDKNPEFIKYRSLFDLDKNICKDMKEWIEKTQADATLYYSKYIFFPLNNII
ncbi:MAG: hypothetical protein MHPSP_000683 [Paramarteilia canceri]